MRSLLLLLLLCAPALAQEPVKVVVAPIVLRGEYLPLTTEQFTQVFAEEVRKLAPHAAVTLPRLTEAPATDQPPTPEEARRLCAQHGATYACWLSVRFRPQLTPNNSSQADLLPGTLAMSGAARLWIWSANATIDEPVSVVRSARVEAGASLPDAARELAGRCAHDLAQQIVTVAQQRAAVARVSGWKAEPAGTAGSEAVLKMCQSADRYQRAVRTNDHIGATDAQRAARAVWPTLTAEEKAQVEQRYPGAAQWMNGDPYFDVNGFWR